MLDYLLNSKEGDRLFNKLVMWFGVLTMIFIVLMTIFRGL